MFEKEHMFEQRGKGLAFTRVSGKGSVVTQGQPVADCRVMISPDFLLSNRMKTTVICSDVIQIRGCKDLI